MDCFSSSGAAEPRGRHGAFATTTVDGRTETEPTRVPRSVAITVFGQRRELTNV